MTLSTCAAGARARARSALSSATKLSRAGVRFAICLSVLLGFAAPETGAQEEPTRLEELVVSDGRVQFFSFSAGGCIVVSDTTVNGVTYTIHESYWQRRSGAGSAWADIPITRALGQVCAMSPTDPGDYRLVADISIDGVRGLYSSNILSVTPVPAVPVVGAIALALLLLAGGLRRRDGTATIT